VDVADWLARSAASARDRGLAPLVPLLETLAKSTAALRAADGELGHPAAEYTEAPTATDGTDGTDGTDATNGTERTENNGRR
jgi:hypothetical protein